MKTLTIKSISEKTVKTQYGDKTLYNLSFTENPEIPVSSFRGQWNKDWKEGTQIEVDDSQWQSREYNGKIYWTLKAPESAKGGGGQEIEGIKRRLSIIESHLGLGRSSESINEVNKEANQMAEEEQPNNGV